VPLKYISRDGRIAVCDLNVVHHVIAGDERKTGGVDGNSGL
jgi:hypothetical protein